MEATDSEPVRTDLPGPREQNPRGTSPIVAYDHVLKGQLGSDPASEGLGERLLCSKATRKVGRVRRIPPPLLQFLAGEYPLRETLAMPMQGGGNAPDLYQIRADAKHAQPRASCSSHFISRTAS